MAKKLEDYLNEALIREDFEALAMIAKHQNFLLKSGKEITAASNVIDDIVSTAANSLGIYYNADFCAVGLKFDEEQKGYNFYDDYRRLEDCFSERAKEKRNECFISGKAECEPLGNNYEMELFTFPVIDRHVWKKDEDYSEKLKRPDYAEDGRYGIIQLARRKKHFDKGLDGAVLARYSRELMLAANDHHATELDPVTGGYTRKRVKQALKYESERKKKHKGYYFSAILLDIDYFKNVNDNHSHAQGDNVLKELWNILVEHFRNADTKGRWGGEEFGIVLPKTTIYEAREKAENLRKKINNYEFRNIKGECPLSITISAGVADSEHDDIMGKADEYLYTAKNSGRNRVCPLPEALKNKKY